MASQSVKLWGRPPPTAPWSVCFPMAPGWVLEKLELVPALGMRLRCGFHVLNSEHFLLPAYFPIWLDTFPTL